MLKHQWERMADASLTELPLSFVDLETTGLNPRFGDRVCEVAVVNYVGDREVARFVGLVDPGRPISPGAMAVNHITNHMVKNAPRFEAIAIEVHRLLQAGVIVAHNAPFDLGFLAAEFHLAGLSMPATPVIDTLALARRCFRFGSNSLDNIAESLGIRTPGHRALADVLTTRKVLQAFAQMLVTQGSPITLGSLLALQGTTGVPLATAGNGHVREVDLQDAVRRGCRLKLTYRASGGDVTERLVDPVELIVGDANGYLVAFCHLREEKRTFKIDRILRWERI